MTVRESCLRVRSLFSSLPVNNGVRGHLPSRMFHFGRLIFLSSLLSLAHAAPAWQGELTSPTPGSLATPVPSILEFQISWKGMIQAGKVKIEFAPADAPKPGKYVVRSHSESVGAASVLFPYHSSFWSEVNPVDLAPVYFSAVEADDKESVSTKVRHSASKAETVEIVNTLKTGTSKQTDRAFAFSPVFDIFSAMLHVRSQKLDTGDQITLALLPFNTPYLLKVKVMGREMHEGRKAIRLSVGMRKINRTSLELQSYKKLKQDATMWLSDDADRIPIELRAAVFIGDVRASLVSHRKP
jgi:hypothetical protein